MIYKAMMQAKCSYFSKNDQTGNTEEQHSIAIQGERKWCIFVCCYDYIEFYDAVILSSLYK